MKPAKYRRHLTTGPILPQRVFEQLDVLHKKIVAKPRIRKHSGKTGKIP